MTAATSTVPSERLDLLKNDQHVMCCRDMDLGLCGLDISAHPIVNAPTTCVVCADLDDITADTGVCPHGGRCP